MTWLMIAALAGSLALHFLGCINTMGIELLGFIVARAWFLMFMKNVELLVGSSEGQT